MAITAPERHPFDPKQPFSRAQARAAGIGLKTLLSSRFQKVFYDCYVSSNVPLTTKLRAKAALGISPSGSFVSHFTAARIWGGIVPDTPDVHVTVSGKAGRTSRQGVKAHARFVLAGLPAPEVNFILRHPDGSWWMRFDMCYPSLKLIIEYDGRQHAEDSNQWLHDLRRREALDRMGWRVIVITKHDYYETPEDVLIRVRDALIERGMVGVRRRFKPEWVRHVIGA